MYRGNLYGGTLSGYQPLNAAHRALMAGLTWPRLPPPLLRSQLLTPAPGVVIAHVRRNDLRPDKAPRLEMAMYVLVERGGQWWLAALPEHAGGRAPAGRRDGRAQPVMTSSAVVLGPGGSVGTAWLAGLAAGLRQGRAWTWVPPT